MKKISFISNVDFRVTSLMLKIRDIIKPREVVLKEVKIEPGFHVLDFGCGPGSYSICAGRLVGDGGKIYATDIHPLALKSVRKKAGKAGLKNVETVLTNGKTGLSDGSVDVVMLYDVFHHLREPEALLKEFHRVLKPGGLLSFSDHHMKEADIVSSVTNSGLFKLLETNKYTFGFGKSRQF
jgi:ubiquinone/menaquinone biosynthesis C-methylase UbiE